MVIIFLGPQGSGKGTQAKLLAEKFGLHYLSMGDVFREVAFDRGDINKSLQKGELLPDEVVMSVLKDYVKANNCKDKVILDGVPRRVSQYEKLKEIFDKVDLAIDLQISRKESIRRLSARRLGKNGEIYNLITNPPPEGVDPKSLIMRNDDKPGAIEERLDEYHKQTEPLLKVLTNEGILVKVDGERSISEINEDLIKIFNDKFNAKI